MTSTFYVFVACNLLGSSHPLLYILFYYVNRHLWHLFSCCGRSTLLPIYNSLLKVPLMLWPVAKSCMASKLLTWWNNKIRKPTLCCSFSRQFCANCNSSPLFLSLWYSSSAKNSLSALSAFLLDVSSHSFSSSIHSWSPAFYGSRSIASILWVEVQLANAFTENKIK